MKPLITLGDKIVGWYLLLRPKWVNKMSGFLIVSGVALLGSPVWKPYVDAYLEKEFGLRVLEENNVSLGLVLILLGLIFYYANEKHKAFIAKADVLDVIEHDANVYKTFLIKNNFAEIRDTMTWIETNHAFFNEDKQIIRDHRRYFSSPEARFLDESLSTKVTAYLESLGALNAFLVRSFFVYPDTPLNPEGLQYCLFPDLNPDRGGSGENADVMRYENFADKLYAATANVLTCQEQLVAALKVSLKGRYPIS